LGDIQSLRETWGGAALFVEPDDAAGLRAAIQALIDSPDFRIDMAGRAFRRALDFSRGRMVESYLAAYRSVIEASAGVA
jgi:glycosyltransferase involved in cell wall biosynthesis